MASKERRNVSFPSVDAPIDHQLNQRPVMPSAGAGHTSAMGRKADIGLAA